VPPMSACPCHLRPDQCNLHISPYTKTAVAAGAGRADFLLNSSDSRLHNRGPRGHSQGKLGQKRLWLSSRSETSFAGEGVMSARSYKTWLRVAATALAFWGSGQDSPCAQTSEDRDAVLKAKNANLATPTSVPLRAREFLDSIGMNVKFRDVASQYGNPGKVIERLQYIGVRLVREGFPARELTPHQIGVYRAFARTGGRFTFETHNEKAVSEIVADISAFEREFPGSVKAVEGPNELNNWPITYQGQKGRAAAKAYMSDLYAAVKADGRLAAAGVLVYGATDWPSIATKADIANIHSYERNAFGSYERLRVDRDDQLKAYATDAVFPPGPTPAWVVTETGYHTWLGSGWFEGVDPTVQAKLGLLLFFNVAKLGGRETQWYQLLDAWGAPRKGEEAFGVFDHTGKPKPLAVTLHNLTTILQDKRDNTRSIATTPLAYKLSGNLGQAPHNGVYDLVLQKSDGTHWLAVWREGQIWNVESDRAIALPAKTTTLQLSGAPARVEIYDPMVGTAPRQTLNETQKVDLALADQLLILRIER
jgi:hypothetical protein